MKIPKLASVAGVLALGLGLAAGAAEDPGDRGPKGAGSVKARVERMKESLGLSEDQAARIEAILTEAAGQGRVERSQARERRRQVHEQIQGVLTEEQRARAAERRAERRKKPPQP
jgi:periplasmic protein CpxP/Spy